MEGSRIPSAWPIAIELLLLLLLRSSGLSAGSGRVRAHSRSSSGFCRSLGFARYSIAARNKEMNCNSSLYSCLASGSLRVRFRQASGRLRVGFGLASGSLYLTPARLGKRARDQEKGIPSFSSLSLSSC